MPDPDWLVKARAEGLLVERGVNHAAFGVSAAAKIDRRDLPENVFQADVIRLAKTFGWMVYHTFDSRRSEEGFPDLVMVRGKRIVCAELKSAGGKTTAAQDAWLAAIRAAGPEVYLWRPADWSAIEAILVGEFRGDESKSEAA